MSDSNKITCPRCGGSGETEHTHIVHGICFLCKGSGTVYPQRVKELSERAKKRKATIEAKHEARRIEMERQTELKWKENHEIGKRGFENALINTKVKATNFKSLDFAFKIYDHKYKNIKFNSELFIDCIKDFTQVTPTISPYREMLVNYFRAKGCFNSSLEYDDTEYYDFNTYRHIEIN